MGFASRRQRRCDPRAGARDRHELQLGIPDARSGEAVKLFVVRRDPAVTEAELLAHCRTQLTNYKVPRSVEFRTELPKTNVGKILRRQLRDMPQTAA